MTVHTLEPWKVGNGHVRSDSNINENRVIFDFRKSRYEDIANAVRIVACVNACAGINPEAVPDLVAYAKEGSCVCENLPNPKDSSRYAGYARNSGHCSFCKLMAKVSGK